MDRRKLRRKVLLDLLSAPWTLVPSVVGASSLLGAWAADAGAGWLAFVGLSGLLAGVGSLATQWILQSDEIIRRAYEDLEADEMAQHERRLDLLHNRLLKDKDTRDEHSLQELRALYRSLRSDPQVLGRLSAQSAVEITSQVEKLYKGCILSLERTAEMVEAARKLNRSKAKTSLLESRETLLAEVFESIEQLAKTIEHVKELKVNSSSTADLARIRQELDESLAVARRVEQRMQSLEQELGSGTPQAEQPSQQ